MEPHDFKQFIEQAASLSQAQRIGLVDSLNRGLQREQTVALKSTTASSSRATAAAGPSTSSLAGRR